MPIAIKITNPLQNVFVIDMIFQETASSMGERANTFINRAIDEAMEQDKTYLCLLRRSTVALEPFLLDVDINKRCFREDLSPRIWYIRDLARKYQCEFIPLNGIFAELSCKNDPSFYSYDGVHPTIEGHKIIAKEILKRIIQED
jgi:lysophospholipase L1-like esterase